MVNRITNFTLMLMKNVLKLILSSLLMFPFTMNAQQQDFPAGTTPNEHNINGADYPQIGRAHV